MLLLLTIINSAVITFSDLVTGRSFLLLICITLNTIFYFLKVKNNNIYYILILPVYVIFRQIFSVDFSKIEFDNVSFLIFYSYFISFILVYISVKEKRKFIIGVLNFYVLSNFVFGIFDYINIDVPFVHTFSNNSERFRGLAIEPNILAVPLTLSMLGYYCYLKKYKLFNNNYLIILSISIAMIWLSGSKAAYTLFIFYLLINLLNRYNFFHILFFLLCFISIILTLFYSGVLQNFPFFNSFILLIEPDIIINQGIESFIQYLSSMDQYQAGSFGTRMATLYSSLSIIWGSPFFGFGEGLSYPYISDYIVTNNLENLELASHLVNNPAFITDKTFLIKYLVDYGFIGLAILFLTYAKFIRSNISNKLTKIQIAMVITFILLNQSPFILVFATIYLSLTAATKLNVVSSNG